MKWFNSVSSLPLNLTAWRIYSVWKYAGMAKNNFKKKTNKGLRMEPGGTWQVNVTNFNQSNCDTLVRLMSVVWPGWSCKLNQKKENSFFYPNINRFRWKIERGRSRHIRPARFLRTFSCKLSASSLCVASLSSCARRWAVSFFRYSISLHTDKHTLKFVYFPVPSNKSLHLHLLTSAGILWWVSWLCCIFSRGFGTELAFPSGVHPLPAHTQTHITQSEN